MFTRLAIWTTPVCLFIFLSRMIQYHSWCLPGNVRVDQNHLVSCRPKVAHFEDKFILGRRRERIRSTFSLRFKLGHIYLRVVSNCWGLGLFRVQWKICILSHKYYKWKKIKQKNKPIVSQHCKSLISKHLTYKIYTYIATTRPIHQLENQQRNRTSNNSSIDRIWANTPSKK